MIPDRTTLELLERVALLERDHKAVKESHDQLAHKVSQLNAELNRLDRLVRPEPDPQPEVTPRLIPRTRPRP